MDFSCPSPLIKSKLCTSVVPSSDYSVSLLHHLYYLTRNKLEILWIHTFTPAMLSEASVAKDLKAHTTLTEDSFKCMEWGNVGLPSYDAVNMFVKVSWPGLDYENSVV